MDEEEIRAEIQRRKQLVSDLKLRETVWDLYTSQFKYIDETLGKDPELVYPAVRETLKRAKNTTEFSFNGINYRLTYIEGKQERDNYDREESVTTPATLTLHAEGQLVFEFDVRTTVIYAREEPIFNKSVRDTKAFIQGPWVEEVPELLRNMRAHAQEVRKRRNAPKETEKLKQEMRKFGL